MTAKGAVATYAYFASLLGSDPDISSRVSGVWADIAPAEAEPPYVVISLSAGDEISWIRDTSLWSISVAVRIVDRDRLERIAEIGDLVHDRVMQAVGVDIAGGTRLLSVRRTRQGVAAEFSGDTVWRVLTVEYEALIEGGVA